MSLVEHHRIAGRAGSANDPQRRPDERALEDLLVDERLGVDVLQVPDAPAGLHLRVQGTAKSGPCSPEGCASHADVSHMVSAMSRAARYSQALRPKPGSPWSKRSRAALRWAEFMDLYRSLLQLLPCPVCSATQSPGAMSRRPCIWSMPRTSSAVTMPASPGLVGIGNISAPAGITPLDFLYATASSTTPRHTKPSSPGCSTPSGPMPTTRPPAPCS